MREPLIFSIAERNQVGEARRRVADLTAGAGLGDVDRERVALLVNELGTNLVKHAGGGILIARLLDGDAVEVLALDRGAGMADVDACFADGYSTAGSPGTGLGAVRRLASAVDVYSARPGGTAIVARVARERDPSRRDRVEVGAVWAPMAGEDVCGDGWAVATGDDGRWTILVVDGLGHGQGAADAARTAERLFAAHPDRPPAEQLDALHKGLRGTRGAAVAVGCVDPRKQVLTFAGIGNVAGAVVADGRARRLVSLGGTAGYEVHRITAFTYPCEDGALVVLHTDGLGGRWTLDAYPGLADRHPSLIAGVLYRDWNRGSDDVTVVAARVRAA